MHLKRLTLSHFRNHAAADLEFSPMPAVLYGANGAGKTNVLEALSFFSAGRGLRSAKLADLTQENLDEPLTQPWAMSLTLGAFDEPDVRLSSALLNDKRVNKIQGEPVKSTTDFSEWLSVLWLTPEHDRLFIDSSKVRRRFLDRMVFAYDPLHATRVMEYEAAMKERLALLVRTRDDRWLGLIEQKMASCAVAIAFARQTLLDRLEVSAQDLCELFPRFKCVHKGDMESVLYERTALEWEEWFRCQWAESRNRDRDAHMTHIGVHRGDFGVLHPQKGQGDRCSTGEQKILLMGVMFAFLMGRLQWDDKLIVMLFDECVSHFDFHHRVVLFEQIQLLHEAKQYPGSFHAIMTGTERELFLPLSNKADFYHVSPSFIQKGDTAQ